VAQRDDQRHEMLTAAVTELRDELRDRLSSHWISSAQELLENHEPNEALLQLAWGIAEEQVSVDQTVRTFIETEVGDPLDLPVDLTGASRPVVSRRLRRSDCWAK
jgi:hypothetical protein